MKTTTTLISTILASTIMLACGGSDGGGSGGSKKAPNADAQGNGSAPVEFVDCDTQWAERVAQARVGEVRIYDYLEVTTGSGELGLDGTVRTRSRVETISATDEAVVIVSSTDYLEPALGTIETDLGSNKETFMLLCEPMPRDVKPDPEALASQGITILEERDANVDVQAGTFATQFLKVQVKSTDGFSSDVLSEHWTMFDESVIVKEKIVVTSAVEGGTMVKTSDKELVEYTPAP